jgi:simple sugar transport system substrate-binding protein
MKLWLLPRSLLILFPLLVSAAEKPAAAQDRLRFVFISTVVREKFFEPVRKGMEDAARMMGVDCVFTGTEGVDVPAQAEMVRKAIRDGVDGIALNIIDPAGFDAAVEEAARAGIPVVAFNVDDGATPNARLSAVCQRLYEAGRTLGRESLKFVPSGSHVLMTMHAKGVSALEDRLRGAQEELKAKDVRWKVVITGNTAAEAAAVIDRELKTNPDIRYVLCTGQADTEGAGLAIEREFKERDCLAAGFDLSPEILRLIKAGAIRFTIDQQPYVQGFYPVIQLALYKRYGIMPSSMDAGAAVITADKVDRLATLTNGKYR